MKQWQELDQGFENMWPTFLETEDERMRRLNKIKNVHEDGNFGLSAFTCFAVNPMG